MARGDTPRFAVNCSHCGRDDNHDDDHHHYDRDDDDHDDNNGMVRMSIMKIVCVKWG